MATGVLDFMELMDHVSARLPVVHVQQLLRHEAGETPVKTPTNRHPLGPAIADILQ